MKSSTQNRFVPFALAVPLVLINLMAVTGQALFAHTHISGIWPVAIGFALALESIAIFLATMAHVVALAGDSALKLRIGAYAMGFLSGGMNYSHFSARSVAAGVGFGVLSALSPWLWAIYTRYVSRDQLRASGLIEPRSVKFSAARWFLWRKETWIALRVAVYSGITDPIEAVRYAAEVRPESAPFPLPEPVQSTPESSGDAPEPGGWSGGVGARNGTFLELLDEEGGNVEKACKRLAEETPHTMGKSLGYDLKRRYWIEAQRVAK